MNNANPSLSKSARWFLGAAAAGVALSWLLLLPAQAQAVPPREITYQGRLKSGGQPANGAQNMTFRLCDHPTNACGSPPAQIYEEIRSAGNAINVTNGLFNVVLGETGFGPLPDNAFAGGNVFLEVIVNGTPLTPRERISAQAYALVAGTATAVVDGAITSAKLGDGAVTSTKLAFSAVTSGKIAFGAVGTFEIADFAVTTNKIGDNAVTSAKLALSAVTSGKIAADAVSTFNIINGGVTNDKLASGAVTSAKLAADAVTSGKIAAGAVGEQQIIDAAVTTNKLGDNAVTSAKLHETSAWGLLAKQTLGAAASTIDLLNLPPRRFLQIRIYSAGKSTLGNASLRFNNDTATNYNDDLATGQTEFRLESAGISNPSYANIDIVNISGNEKLMTWLAAEFVGTASSTTQWGGAAQWNNTSAQINRVTLLSTGGGTFNTGTEMHIYGRN